MQLLFGACLALRGLFLIDPDGVVIHNVTNFLPVGRSAKEALRTLKAFQFVSENDGQVCPADCMEKNWRPLLAEPEDTSMGRWVVLENEAGQRQWSYEGRLLYSHTRDEKPGDMVGNGVGVGYRIGDGWRVILVETGLRRR